MPTVSNKPWSKFSASDYTDADDYCRASLIDDNEAGASKSKDKCHLPVKEPKGGPLNRNGIHAAAQRLGSVQSSKKAQAAKKLVGLYTRVLNETPPDSVKRLAKG